jgi:tryptophan synthase alpha chain
MSMPNPSSDGRSEAALPSSSSSSSSSSSRIAALFARKPQGVLSVYCTAGFPQLADTVPVLQALERSGVDMIEIGIPFSDPIADGPTIQASSQAALDNGMTLQTLFDQLRDVRSSVALPLVLMGYVNPIIQFGVAAFCQCCAAVGIDGVIVPDLPVETYEQEFAQTFAEYGVANILLVTPQTSDERIRRIDAASRGFLYAVSSAGTTGGTLALDAERLAYFARLKALALSNPVMIGFGISDKVSFDAACSHANGAIVGSAFIKALAENTAPLEAVIAPFVQGFRG